MSSKLFVSILLCCLAASVVTASPVKESRSTESSGLSLTSWNGSTVAGSTVSKASTSSSYTFDANSTDNVMVYYGATDASTTTNLTAQCRDSNIDVVILAFITDIIGGGGYPDISFTALCGGQTSAMKTAGATGLVECNSLASQIVDCQTLGKKVFISVGGADGNTTFSSSSDASDAATMLWNIFGNGTGEDSGLRPFGDVDVDGFDIDNETGGSDYYTDFVTALSKLFDTQTKKTYYLSASVECYYPSDAAPLDLLNMMNFVAPQFYGSPTCNLGTDNFKSSFSAWSARLSGPRLQIGAPSWVNGTTDGGYEDGTDFATTIKDAKTNVSANNNFGGVTLWDGPYGLLNNDSSGNDFIADSKAALES